MRLIDLDQTIFVPIVDEGVGTSYELQMTVGEFFDKFFEGDVPETVDAIPVEWPMEKVKTPTTGFDPFVYVLFKWRKEQVEA